LEPPAAARYWTTFFSVAFSSERPFASVMLGDFPSWNSEETHASSFARGCPLLTTSAYLCSTSVKHLKIVKQKGSCWVLERLYVIKRRYTMRISINTPHLIPILAGFAFSAEGCASLYF